MAWMYDGSPSDDIQPGREPRGWVTAELTGREAVPRGSVAATVYHLQGPHYFIQQYNIEIHSSPKQIQYTINVII